MAERVRGIEDYYAFLDGALGRWLYAAPMANRQMIVVTQPGRVLQPSAGLLAISIWMRLQLKESPEFEKARTEGRLSQAPYADVFLKWKSMKIVLIALFSVLR